MSAEAKPRVREVVLVLADISGYTAFVTANRTALEHSQLLISELLTAVIREARVPLSVAKVEGDAVFLYAARGPGDWAAVKRRIRSRIPAFYSAFRSRLAVLRQVITCGCTMCANVDQLRLKVIVHAGEAFFTRVGGHAELLGVDVVAVHRLLKNSVPESEYLLTTEEAAAELDLPETGRTLHEHYDGLGDLRTRLYLPTAFDGWAEEPRPQPIARLFAWAGFR